MTYVLTGQGTIGVRDVVVALAGGGYKGIRFRMGEAVAPGHRRAGGRLSAVRRGHDPLVVGGRGSGPLARSGDMVIRPLLTAVRRELKRRANPGKAAGMRAYMKSAMPYLGVQTPGLREACRLAFAAHPLDSLRRLARHGAGAVAAGAVP